MTQNWEEVMGAALSLPPGMRAMLAEHLLESLDSDGQNEVDAKWAEEVEARIAEIDDGWITLIQGEDVLHKLKSRN